MHLSVCQPIKPDGSSVFPKVEFPLQCAAEKNLLNTKGWKQHGKCAEADCASTERAPETAFVQEPTKRTRVSAHTAKIAKKGLEDQQGSCMSHRTMLPSCEEACAMIAKTEADSPGADPMPFLNEPRDIQDTDEMQTAVARAWIKSFTSEITGVLVKRGSCKIEDPLPDDIVTPIMATFRTKLDKDGLPDKTKTRAAFRGDLCDPKDMQDSWNPSANFNALKMFAAESAQEGTFPIQIDHTLAHPQAKMKE